jgi:hypothetical protein
VAIGDEPALQVKAREAGHLQIGNEARGLSEACGLQEPLGGFEAGYIVPQRIDQVSERFPDKSIVINNGNHGSCQFTIPIS